LNSKFSLPAILFLLIHLALGCVSTKFNPSDTPLDSYSFEKVDSLLTDTPRSIAVFIHTDWCRYCKSMEQTTLRDAEVVQSLNDNYYYVSFNAESRESIHFHGNTFAFEPRSRNTGTHELAKALGTVDGSLLYPTFVILNPEYEIVFQHDGFMSAKQMRRVLRPRSF